NRSRVAVKISVRLEHISPPNLYQVPAYLQLTGSAPPHRETIIPGDGEALVDLIEEPEIPIARAGGIIIPGSPYYGLNVSTVLGLLSAEDPPSAVPIPRRNYDLLIRAFVTPDGGNAALRRFSILIQPDNTIITTDAGTPYQASRYTS